METRVCVTGVVIVSVGAAVCVEEPPSTATTEYVIGDRTLNLSPASSWAEKGLAEAKKGNVARAMRAARKVIVKSGSMSSFELGLLVVGGMAKDACRTIAHRRGTTF